MGLACQVHLLEARKRKLPTTTLPKAHHKTKKIPLNLISCRLSKNRFIQLGAITRKNKDTMEKQNQKLWHLHMIKNQKNHLKILGQESLPEYKRKLRDTILRVTLERLPAAKAHHHKVWIKDLALQKIERYLQHLENQEISSNHMENQLLTQLGFLLVNQSLSNLNFHRPLLMNSKQFLKTFLLYPKLSIILKIGR